MTGSFWNRKALLLIGAVLACVTLAISIGLAYPTPVESPTLGAEWQCRRAAIVTTCRRVSHAEPTLHHTHKHLIDTRRA
ncbi:MAG TPA: hypothetical protein VID30_08210 [Bradyrhizobium sp.]|jgi:hypothetical protein